MATKKAPNLIVSNRIKTAIETVEKRLPKLPQVKVDKIDKDARLTDYREIHTYQNLQSRMHAMGKLNTTDAMWLYNMLGKESGNMERFNSYPIADRCVALELIALLAEIRL
jgi:hypothetical protein